MGDERELNLNALKTEEYRHRLILAVSQASLRRITAERSYYEAVDEEEAALDAYNNFISLPLDEQATLAEEEWESDSYERRHYPHSLEAEDYEDIDDEEDQGNEGSPDDFVDETEGGLQRYGGHCSHGPIGEGIQIGDYCAFGFSPNFCPIYGGNPDA